MYNEGNFRPIYSRGLGINLYIMLQISDMECY